MAFKHRPGVAWSSPARQHGFSLIELMVVVAIIAIIASIALPNYNEHMRTARRAAGAACLSQGAQQMERFYTTNLTYNGAPAPACDPDTSQFYTLNAPVTGQTTYTLTAVRRGKQAGDRCGDLALNQAGTRVPNDRSCW